MFCPINAAAGHVGRRRCHCVGALTTPPSPSRPLASAAGTRRLIESSTPTAIPIFPRRRLTSVIELIWAHHPRGGMMNREQSATDLSIMPLKMPNKICFYRWSLVADSVARSSARHRERVRSHISV